MKAAEKTSGLSRRDFMKAAGMVVVAGVVLRGGPALANKSAVRIVAPESAGAGEEINIELHVSHKGNNFFHHTEWVYVQINDEEVQRWTYGARSRPENETFTVTLRHTMNASIVIKAEASCNIHGSEGPAQASVTLQ